MSWFPCQIWNISICEVHNSVRSIILVSFAVVDFVYTLPSSSAWYEEISYKYICLLRRFHQFLVYVFILCMCTPIGLTHFIYFDTAIPTFPQKNCFRLWEGTNGGGDPGDCGLLSCKLEKSMFRPQVDWMRRPDHSKEWWCNVAGWLSWKENV